MSPTDARVALLAAQIRADWDAVVSNRDRSRSVDPGIGAPECALVAIALHHAWQAFESLLVRISRALEIPVPEGDRWHQELLSEASLDIPGVRGAVVPAEARRSWQELLHFRHFLRHAYAAELEPAELRKNAAFLDDATRLTAPRVEAMVDALLID